MCFMGLANDYSTLDCSLKYYFVSKPLFTFYFKLIGSCLAEEIAQDLDSPSDPIGSSSIEQDVQSHKAWWAIIQRTGHVVGILQSLHSRAFIGNLQIPSNFQTPKKVSPKGDQNNNQSEAIRTDPVLSNWKNAMLIPTDTRLPRVFIPREACPEGECKLMY